MNELIGQTFKQYRILSLLGRGGMGTVYRAIDLKLNRDVAMKVMHDDFAARPTIVKRFVQEAQITGKLDHPGIIKVFDFDLKHNPPYIIMEFINGGNLRKLLERRRAPGRWIPMGEAVRLLRQVCLALDYAHRHKILHRDIKPDNLMIKMEPCQGLPYRVILTDLGLAKLLEAEGEPITRVDAAGMGTPAYMSPEQARGAAMDARSDVYSLGVLAYELVAGRLPFSVKDLADANHYHNNVAPPPPSSCRRDIPVSLEQIILRALEKKPESRFPNAAELARALKDLESAAAEVESMPTELEKSETLTIAYEQSLQGERGPSIFRNFPEIDDRRHDHIQVLLNMYETPQAIRIESEMLAIGRSGDNNLPLEDSKVSRHHARLSFDGENYQITDLNSANGTFLGNIRLLPDVPQVWKPEVPLRIGGVWLRLVRAQQTSAMISSITGATSLDAPRFHTSAGTGCVGILIEPEQICVEPGQSATATIRLLNQSAIVDHFSVTISGIPQNWIAKPLPSVQLLPREQKEITLTLEPPRQPQSRAGRHAFTLRAFRQGDPTEAAELKVTLTVAEYFQFHCDLQPQRIRAGQNARVTVQNQGNLPETFNLLWNDRANELAFDPAQMQLKVNAGQTASAEFRAAPRKARWMGNESLYRFTAHVSHVKGQVQSLNGEVVSRALVPGWGLPTTIFLCLLLLVSAPAIRPLFFPSAPTPTVTPTLMPGISTEVLPNAPLLEEWCVYPQDHPPSTFQNCPVQVRVEEGQTVMIRWNVRNVTEVEIDPLGKQSPAGEISYTVSTNKPITLKASNAIQPAQWSIELLVTSAAPSPTSTPVPSTATSTLALVPPTLTPTATRTFTPIPPLATVTPIGGGAGKIAFSSNQNGNHEIYVMNSDGSGLINLTNNSASDSSAAWSPDGKRIVFGSDRGASPEFYVMNADGSNPVRLTNYNMPAGSPNWSPDGTKIAFYAATGSDTYSEEIFVMNADGSNLIRLTEDRSIDFDPSWSPDGTKIVFCSTRNDGNPEIYVMNADGTGLLNLTNNSAFDFYPKWSPDGRKISFSSTRDGGYDIYVMNTDGSGLVRLTQNSAVEHLASWSPDGRKIVFVSSRNDPNPSTCAENCKYEIYVMNADGSGQIQLTNVASYIVFPVWSP